MSTYYLQLNDKEEIIATDGQIEEYLVLNKLSDHGKTKVTVQDRLEAIISQVRKLISTTFITNCLFQLVDIELNEISEPFQECVEIYKSISTNILDPPSFVTPSSTYTSSFRTSSASTITPTQGRSSPRINYLTDQLSIGPR